MAKRVKVSSQLSEPVARAVRFLAAHEDRSPSDIVEEALEAHLIERHENLAWLEAAQPTFDFWDNDVEAAYDTL